MKLATVNPRLDNIEGLLSKDVRTRDLVLSRSLVTRNKNLTNKGALYNLILLPASPLPWCSFVLPRVSPRNDAPAAATTAVAARPPGPGSRRRRRRHGQPGRVQENHAGAAERERRRRRRLSG